MIALQHPDSIRTSGRRSRRIFAVPPLAWGAPQRSRPQRCPPSRQRRPLRHRQRPRQRHLVPSHPSLQWCPPCRPLLRRRPTLSIALWISTSSGRHPRRSGAAGCTTFADSQRSRLLPRTRTIAQMGSPTGRQVGPRRRRSGAVHTTARAALVRAMAARRSAPPPLLTTATRASPTGALAGARHLLVLTACVLCAGEAQFWQCIFFLPIG